MAPKIIWEEINFSGKFLEFSTLNIEWWNKYEMVKRKWWKNAVACIISHISNKTYILIEQFRYPIGQKTLELVAWVCDKDKSEIDIIQEEVIEETWYKNILSVDFLANCTNSAWLTSETTKVYYVQVDWKREEQDLWEMEDIQVIEVWIQEINNFIKSKIESGVLIDPKIFVGLYMSKALGLD